MAGDDIRIGIGVTGEQQAQKALKDTGAAAKKAGDNLHDMGKETGFVSKEMDEATRNIKRLSAELDKTGDKSLLKAIAAERRRLAQFSKVAGDLPDAGGGGGGASSILNIAPPQAKAAAAGVGALFAPTIGAAVSAAVLGGVGVGGIVGGIALAADDPAVSSAADAMAGVVSSRFDSLGESFAAPAAAALDTLASTGVQAADKLAPGMDKLAGTIAPLAEGIDGLIDGISDGLGPALEAAAPVVRTIAQELPTLGRELGGFLSDISEDPDGAILAMKQLFDITGDVIDGTGKVIAGLSQVYEWSVRAGASATGALEDFYGWIPGIGGAIADTNDRLENQLNTLDKVKISTDDLGTSTSKVTYHTFQLGIAADEAADSLDAQREAMSKLVDLELAAVGGTIAYERAIDNLTEARKENGKSLDLDTEKGRSNTEAILASIEAVKENAEREYDLAIAHGATAQEAEQAARTYRDTFGKELKAQIIKLFGNTDAVKALLAELDKLNGKRITYTIVQKGGRTIGFKADGGIQLKDDEGIYRRAAGGPVRQGPLYWVGENGPELVEFNGSGTVHSNSASRAMVGGTGGGGAASGVTQVALSAKPGSMQELVRFMLPYIQVEVISQGGDAQEVLGAPSR